MTRLLNLIICYYSCVTKTCQLWISRRVNDSTINRGRHQRLADVDADELQDSNDFMTSELDLPELPLFGNISIVNLNDSRFFQLYFLFV